VETHLNCVTSWEEMEEKKYKARVAGMASREGGVIFSTGIQPKGQGRPSRVTDGGCSGS
jgi:hypothetical protein